MPPRWVVECKKCAKEFTFHSVDEQHPREVVSNMVEPPKPPLRHLAEARTCPHCNEIASYKKLDLEFRAD